MSSILLESQPLVPTIPNFLENMLMIEKIYALQLETSKENLNSFRMKYNELNEKHMSLNDTCDDLTKKVRQLG